MYITPDSKIYILKNIPLDPTYDHTIYWGIADGDDDQHTASKAAQASYFSSKAKYTLTNQSYQRLQRGWMSIRIKTDNLYDCNYIMFQNTAYGNKWFYAFLKTVEYKNDNVSEVEFEIDEMQTWWFDYHLEKCFVEREHTVTDELFGNIIDEGLDIGDEMVCNSLTSFNMNNLLACVFVNRTPTGSATSAPASYINGVYAPIRIYDRLEQGVANIDSVLDQFIEDDIVTVFQYPAFMNNPNPAYDPNYPTDYSWDRPGYEVNPKYYRPYIPRRETVTIRPNFVTIDGEIDNPLSGYRPINNKLWTYPFNYLMVTNNCGNSNIYHWDNFQGISHEGATFEVSGTYITMPVALCYPTMYKGIHFAYEESLSYTNFPQCAWSGDSFKAWWAQNKNSFGASLNAIYANTAAQVGGAVATGLMGAATLSPIMATVSVGGAIASLTSAMTQVDTLMAKKTDMAHYPNRTFGQATCDCLNAGLQRIQFDFYQMSIKKEYAKTIDDYFTRYGYACKENKVPNRNARPHWTYTKTIGCTINGSIPADSATKICSIYNAGITFWRNPSEVGNYDLDNRPD